MTNREEQYELAEKWVVCLDCSFEYMVQNVVDDHDAKGCPICGSHTYEEPPNEFNDWGF
ncbi:MULTISPECIES: hypothetical protein [Bacillus subtilis group]|uniref:hypothetical protein n=1 Tax=Bacillus subtilis group TaxID=653685 RepID=UPI001A90D0EF|nr:MULTISPECIES: hypothetical protein [Bacillus subtilis group]MCY9308853.1 hypothetical protein [Bacillus inaquosorum]BCT30430.1 hypothetical protein BVAD3_41040 [Bacillus velezensis]